MKIDALTKDIKEFVSGGGFDAYSFSIKYAPDYGNIPGRDLQLMIDDVRGRVDDVSKVLVREYVSFGKGDGEELRDQYLINDTPEERKNIIDNTYYDYTHVSAEDFIEGKSDVFDYESFGGDWDDPTGGYIILQSKEDVINTVTGVYNRELYEIERLFKEE